MATKDKQKEVTLHFDWLELAIFMAPGSLGLLHAYCVYFLHDVAPFFFLLYVVIPYLDLYSSKAKNHTENEQRLRSKDWRFLIPIYFFFVTYWIDVYATFEYMVYVFDNHSYLRCALIIPMLWLTGGKEVIVGHEMGHRKSCIHRFLGYLLYLRFLNTTFIITHNKGHHKWVATPLDAASASKGQTVFQFIAHSIPYSFIQGWKIEEERIEKNHGPEVSPILKILLNQILIMKLGEVMYLGAVYYIWGFKMLCFAVLLGFLLQCSLEIINYVEHYGLRRKEISPGKYERVTIKHSWNSSHSLVNYLQFRLPRHSDHHESGSKPYQALQNCEESPQLPFSYLTAMTLTLNPKRWFKAMDPLVQIYQEEQRKPTKEEADRARAIAKHGVITSMVQNTLIILVAYLV